MIDTEDEPPREPDQDAPLQMIVQAKQQCGRCRMRKDRCGCMPTTDDDLADPGRGNAGSGLITSSDC